MATCIAYTMSGIVPLSSCSCMQNHSRSDPRAVAILLSYCDVRHCRCLQALAAFAKKSFTRTLSRPTGAFFSRVSHGYHKINLLSCMTVTNTACDVALALFGELFIAAATGMLLGVALKKMCAPPQNGARALIALLPLAARHIHHHEASMPVTLPVDTPSALSTPRGLLSSKGCLQNASLGKTAFKASAELCALECA